MELMVDSANRGWTHIWQYGDKHEKLTNLGGTYRTLDGIDGRCDLGDGILSEVGERLLLADIQYGFSQIDDSGSMLFTEDGWVAGRDPAKKDIYLFAYGLGRPQSIYSHLLTPDHRAALKAFYMVSGKTPLIPRWALGNWWSRYCESHCGCQLNDRCLLGQGVSWTHGSLQGGKDSPFSRSAGH